MPGQKGNKGGGRRSAYEEKTAAEIVKQIFAGEYKISPKAMKAIVEKNPTGLSGWDMVAYKVYSGNDSLLATLVNKLVGDKIDPDALKNRPHMLLIDV